ncbi:MAG: sigma-54 dependent transcriptional regulator [Desulfocapsaceae bacterium]|nr:sigma-54 dependent transcriptional regulator [Desulfocapsaceae bacterium]
MRAAGAPTVLVVDDEQVHRYMLCNMLKEWGWRCVEADDGDTAVRAVEQNAYDAVLMDVRMARMSGRRAFDLIHAHNPVLPVIIMTAYSSVDDAVEIIKKGAHDYLTKPLDFSRLRLSLERAVDHHQVEEKKQQAAAGGNTLETSIIGTSAPVAELLEMIRYVAPTEATVLVTGESGTGKELVAEALHFNSERKGGPFVKVNCAALAESLLESELFGHEKGAFTGADRRRDGKFVQADGGTLFLDEIGETTPAMQVKLLRVLQEGELQRVGGEETISVDVRILAATNRDLETDAQNGSFREDLYYRLNVVTLVVPPLRLRGNDINLLVDHFVALFGEKNRRQVTGVTPSCMKLLKSYPWPGNVRELENAIERGIILMRGDQLTEKSLPLSIQKYGSEKEQSDSDRPASLQDAEKALIVQTLKDTGGNKSEAARRLGITRKTLQNKLHKYQQGQ